MTSSKKYFEKFIATKLFLTLSVTSLSFGSKAVWAADIFITVPTTAAQELTVSGQALNVSGAGDIAVSGGGLAAVYTPAMGAPVTGVSVNVNTNSAATGIRSSGGVNSAIAILSSDTIVAITLTAGTITSDRSGGATVLLKGAGGITNISTAQNTTLSNSAVAGFAIDSSTTSNTALTVTNAGVISVNNNAASTAINAGDSTGFSSLTVANTGLINAGHLGTAINLNNSGNTLSVTNSADGIIIGAIAATGNNATVANNGNGEITGNISTTTGSLGLVNNTTGTITGNISSTGGNLNVTNNAGTILGNITSTIGNTSLNIMGGTVTGDVTSTSGSLSISSAGTLNGNISTASGNLNATVVGGLVTGNINLGSNVGSALAIDGGNIIGAVTMHDAAQNTTFGGGALAGTIDGAGSVIADNASVNLGGAIGSLAAVTLVQVKSGDTLSASTYNINATTILLESGATLGLNGGTLAGALQGSSDGVGTLSLGQNFSSSGNLGVAANSLAAINVAAGKTFTLSIGDGVDVGAVNLGAASGFNMGSGTVVGAVNLATNAILTIGSGSLTGVVDGSAANSGTVNLNATNTWASGTKLGSVNGLAAVNVADGATIAANDSIKAISVNVGGGTSGEIDLASSKSIMGAVTLASGAKLNLANSSAVVGAVVIGSGATLTMADASSVSGVINGATSGVGTLNIASGATVVTNVNVGVTKLASVILSSGATLNAATNNDTIGATTVSLGAGATLLLGGGVVTGTIKGTSDGTGTVSLSQNITPVGDIGVAGNKLSEVTIAAGKTLDLSSNHDVFASDVVLATGSVVNFGGGTLTGNLEVNGGTLNFGDTARTISSNISGNGSSTINLGSASHTNNGSFTLGAGDTLRMTINNGNNSGSITSTGAASTNANTNLDVSIGTISGYINNGALYTVVSGGAGSSIVAINSSKIDINDSGTNKVGLLTFSTKQSGNDLLLSVAKGSASDVSGNASEQHAYGAIDGAGSGATGELLALQNYIINNGNITDAQRQHALQSLTPNATGLNKSTFDATNASIHTTENRLEIIRDIHRFGLYDSPGSADARGYKILNKQGVAVAQADNSSETYASAESDIASKSLIRGTATDYSITEKFNKSKFNCDKLKYGVWAQAFGTSAKQDNNGNFNGYNALTTGLSFGADTKVSHSTSIGAALSIANSKIKSSDDLKTTKIGSYQANIYSGTILGKYFIDGVAGVNFNRYDSDRSVPVVGVEAKANYGGETYSAKIKTGFIERFGNNIELIPEVSAIYARNHIDNYTETGAGTLGLAVQNHDANFLEGAIGVGLGYNSIEYKDAKIYPKIKLTYGYDFIGNRQTATSNFIGQSVSFDSQSSTINRESIKVDAGINVYAIDHITISANYILEKKRTYESHSGLLRVRYEF